MSPSKDVVDGAVDNKDSMNNLGSRRAMMHSVVMADCLWEMIKAE